MRLDCQLHRWYRGDPMDPSCSLSAKGAEGAWKQLTRHAYRTSRGALMQVHTVGTNPLLRTLDGRHQGSRVLYFPPHLLLASPIRLPLHVQSHSGRWPAPPLHTSRDISQQDLVCSKWTVLQATRWPLRSDSTTVAETNTCYRSSM